MTAAPVLSPPSPPRPGAPLGPLLEQVHRKWLQELRAIAEKANTRERDIWARWKAIRYVDTVFWGQFDRERSAIAKLADSPPLWIAGELVSTLRRQLRDSVGLCHRQTDFTILMGKLVRAVAYWFATVEEIVGPIMKADLSPEARQELAELDLETAPPWSDLPCSLVTSL